MRSETEMFALILDVAREDERIRAVLLNGSRADKNVPKDIFQDYDVVYMVTGTASFIRDPGWIDVFGERFILQLPDEMDKLLGHPYDFDKDYGYLMQFTDGNRIDLHIREREYALAHLHEDSCTVVLLDKDHALPPLPESSDKRHLVQRPSQDLFFCCCNEFWWVILYVAKGLWREEITYAMDALETLVRPQLLKMLTWYAGKLTDFSCGMGKSGKYLPRYLSGADWSKYLLTYPRADVPDIWDSVFTMADLFDETAQQVGTDLGLIYNNVEAQNCLAYLRRIRTLPKDAADIY